MSYFSNIEEIQILIFTVMGVKFGMDMEMIREMSEIEQAKARKVQLFHIPQQIRFDNINAVPCRSPKVLIIKNDNQLSGIIIEQPEEINVTVKITDILPLPYLIERLNPNSPLWACVIHKNEIVLLLDPFKLINRQTM